MLPTQGPLRECVNNPTESLTLCPGPCPCPDDRDRVLIGELRSLRPAAAAAVAAGQSAPESEHPADSRTGAGGDPPSAHYSCQSYC